MQTGKWTSFQPDPNVRPVFEAEDILQRMDAIAIANARIAEVCAIAGLPLLRVAYEDVVADPLLQMRRIATFIGRDFAASEAPSPDISRQGDALNADFVRRFQDWACARGGLGRRAEGSPPARSPQ